MTAERWAPSFLHGWAPADRLCTGQVTLCTPRPSPVCETCGSPCSIFTDPTPCRRVLRLESSAAWWWCASTFLIRMYQMCVLLGPRPVFNWPTWAVSAARGDNTVYLATLSVVARMFPQSVSHQAGGGSFGNMVSAGKHTQTLRLQVPTASPFSPSLCARRSLSCMFSPLKPLYLIYMTGL